MSYELIILVVVVVYFIIMYNKFIALRASIDGNWSDIDVQLKKRYNLIPALVETVKSYIKYENETFQDIVRARNNAQQSSNIEEKGQLENALNNSLGKLFLLTEDYPDLKANTTFLNLQNELTDVEDDIENARRYYNAVVRDYNTKVDSFPDLIVARVFKFMTLKYFELENQSHRNMPKVEIQ